MLLFLDAFGVVTLFYRIPKDAGNGHGTAQGTTQRHAIEWHWLKGHAGDAMNERADALANEGMEPFKPKKREA